MDQEKKKVHDLVVELDNLVKDMIEKKNIYIEAVVDVHDKAKEILGAREFKTAPYKECLGGMERILQNAKEIIEAAKK